MKNKSLLYTGILTPVIFWTTTIICGFVFGNYNHATRMVSELGAIGTSSQYLFTTGLVLSSVFSILFIIGLYKTAKARQMSTIPVLLILTFSFSICGAGLFPLPLRLHGILGMPSMFLLLSPLSCMLLWRKENISGIKYFPVLALAIMMMGFSVYMPDFLGEYIGLKQRFFHFGWSIWFVYLSLVFLKLNREKETELLVQPLSQ
jgi:hypothetical membrane protein